MGSSNAMPRCGSLPTADAVLSDVVIDVVLGFITLLAGQPVARVFRHGGARGAVAKGPFRFCITQLVNRPLTAQPPALPLIVMPGASPTNRPSQEIATKPHGSAAQAKMLVHHDTREKLEPVTMVGSYVKRSQLACAIAAVPAIFQEPVMHATGLR